MQGNPNLQSSAGSPINQIVKPQADAIIGCIPGIIMLVVVIVLCIWAFFGGGLLHNADLWVPIVLLIIAIVGIVLTFVLLRFLGDFTKWFTLGLGILCLFLTVLAWYMSTDLSVDNFVNAATAASTGDVNPALDLLFELSGVDLREFSTFIGDTFGGMLDIFSQFGFGTDSLGTLTGEENVGNIEIPGGDI